MSNWYPVKYPTKLYVICCAILALVLSYFEKIEFRIFIGCSVASWRIAHRHELPTNDTALA